MIIFSYIIVFQVIYLFVNSFFPLIRIYSVWYGIFICWWLVDFITNFGCKYNLFNRLNLIFINSCFFFRFDLLLYKIGLYLLWSSFWFRFTIRSFFFKVTVIWKRSKECLSNDFTFYSDLSKYGLLTRRIY